RSGSPAAGPIDRPPATRPARPPPCRSNSSTAACPAPRRSTPIRGAASIPPAPAPDHVDQHAQADHAILLQVHPPLTQGEAGVDRVSGHAASLSRPLDGGLDCRLCCAREPVKG